MQRLVVAGAGLAGLRAAEGARQRGFDGEIVLFGNEDIPPYNRPLLSKQILAGEAGADECFFDTDGLDVQWILGTALTGLDVANRQVLFDGGAMAFDKLVIATGRRARTWPGTSPAGMHVLRTLGDALQLRAAVGQAGAIVVIGGGFIGCEVAATLRGLGREVTILEQASHLLAPIGEYAGAWMTGLHRANGVRVECNVEIDALLGDDRIEGVRLGDGRVVRADLVLSAIGSLPNTEWLSASGLQLDRGAVVVDEACRASGHPDIVAAGDVACWTRTRTGRRVHIEHWTHAAEMARFAAQTAIDGRAGRSFAPTPTFWSDQYGARLRSVGFLADGDATTVVEDSAESSRLCVELLHERGLAAAVTYNHEDAYMNCRRRLAALEQEAA